MSLNNTTRAINLYHPPSLVWVLCSGCVCLLAEQTTSRTRASVYTVMYENECWAIQVVSHRHLGRRPNTRVNNGDETGTLWLVTTL